MNSVMDWLLAGDASIQYQVHRDLLFSDASTLKRTQNRIELEGWGANYLLAQNAGGYWGQGFYRPKWTSSHYTLLELKNLSLPPENNIARQAVQKILHEEKGMDGGVDPSRAGRHSDVCINGMFLNYGTYFGVDPEGLKSVVDFTLSQHMQDGGFNCQSNRAGAVHSSLHTTLSVLEGFWEYGQHGYTYRLSEIKEAERQSREFILEHRLYKSSTTGAVIDSEMLRLSHPTRWRYDILKALDYFRVSGVNFDSRMQDAILVLRSKQGPDGTWPLQARHDGEVYFQMESVGKPSRWNTLRAMRVLNFYPSIS